jgi:hypothetical protein
MTERRLRALTATESSGRGWRYAPFSASSPYLFNGNLILTPRSLTTTTLSIDATEQDGVPPDRHRCLLADGRPHGEWCSMS